MKVYSGNWNGRAEAMVAARNQKEAAMAIGTSVYDFRRFYSKVPKAYEGYDLAVNSPGTVFIRPMRQKDEWVQR